MSIPEFRIRLTAPTSTTMHIEVATNFSGQHGMLLQFRNRKRNYFLTGFDCSWISRYKGESERLFFGGNYYIRLETIILRSTNENFSEFISALFYLDTMLSGGFYAIIESINISSNQLKIISSLMQWKQGNDKKQFHSYIHDTFESFCR
eukprot:838016_1